MTNTLTATSEYMAKLQQHICPGASPAELQLFADICQRTQLDPFAGHIYAIMRNVMEDGKKVKRMTVQVSVAGFRITALRSGLYEGQTKPEWCDEAGHWRDIWLEETPPTAARVGVYRRGFREPMYGLALWKESAQTAYSGELTKFWKDRGVSMLAKAAEADALRKAFPMDLQTPGISQEQTAALQADIYEEPMALEVDEVPTLTEPTTLTEGQTTVETIIQAAKSDPAIKQAMQDRIGLTEPITERLLRAWLADDVHLAEAADMVAS